MALDERYIISPPIDQVFVDKDTGLPLSGGKLYFYRDNPRSPITLKSVYQLTGSPGNYTYTPLPNPITLSSVGTIQNAAGDNEILYFYPYDSNGDIDLYYIVCTDANGVEQFTRDAFPNIVGGNDPSEEGSDIVNQIANPQFSRVFINDSPATTYTVSGSTTTFEFAPDWSFTIAGTGSVTVTRTAVAGSSQVPTNPPFYLTVTVPTGITSCILRQRMNVNSGLWSSTSQQDIYLSSVLVGRNENAGTAGLEMYYQESTSTGDPVLILEGDVIQGAWTVIKSGSDGAMPQSTNSDTGSSGYVDVYISFPLNSSTSITSVQVIPSLNDNGIGVTDYELQTANREQALMGDYFIPNLEAKQISSLLVGWDFPLNPAQWGASASLGSANPVYMWDQTIVKDTAGAVAYARNTVTGGLQFTTPASTNSVAICQFLTAPEAEKILGNYLSVNVNGFRNAAGAAVTMRVYLYSGTTAAAFPSIAANQFIATLATDGTLTSPFSGWTEIPRGGLPVATATLGSVDIATTDWSQLNDAANDRGFNNWRLTTDATIKDTHKFAVVVTFAYTAATVIVVNSVSCVPGNIPCRPAIQSAAQVLEDCQYYYQKSFNVGTAAAQNVGQNTGESLMPLTVAAPGLNIFSTIVFPVNMRIAPTITTYNPVAANAFVRNYTATSDATSTSSVNVTSRGFYLTFEPSSGSVGGSNAIHWQAEARLGL